MTRTPRRPGVTGPAAPGRHGPAVLVLALVLLATLVGVAVPTTSRAATAPADPVEVLLDSITPTTPTPGSTVQVTGSVVNRSDRPVRDLVVRLRVSGEPIGTRGELAALAKGSTVRDGHAVRDSTVPVAATLDPGATEVFTLTVPADGLGLGGFGVYPLAVEARGRLATRGTAQLGLTHTFLPWMPATVQPTKVSWLWPLVTSPRRDAQGQVVGDQLASELSRDGRLGRLVAEGSYLPVTWVVDPDLLDAAAALAGSTSATPVATPVATETPTPSPSPTPTPGGGIEAGIAQQWLGALAGGTTGREVVALPYADPDVVALHRAGLDDDLRGTREQGPAVAQRVLGRFVTGDIAWPAGGLLDQSTADTLTDLGVGAAILDPAARPPVRAPWYTPDGRTDVTTRGGGSLAGLVYDRTLSQLMTADTSAPGQQALLVQRVLAETAMITAERPADSRAVLIAPPREWAPTPGLAQLLVESASRAGWIETVPLSTLREQAPDETITRAPLTYPAKARAAELAPRHLQRVADLEHDLTTFSHVLTEPDALLPPYRTAAYRLGSTHWRSDAEGASRLADTIGTNVTSLRESVELVATPVTFGSNTGTFPLTIVNRLDQAVIVDLYISPRTPRLEVKPTEPLTIRAQRSEQANVTASANANGLVFVDARLQTPVGEPLGPVVSFRVTVTQIGTMGLLVTVGAAAVLFVAAGVRVGRRAMLARRRGRAS